MEENKALWHIFETTGSVEAYLNYSKNIEKDEKSKTCGKETEADGIGTCGNRGDNHKEY